MIDFEKTHEVPIRLVFRGDSTPDFISQVVYTDDNKFMVFTDNNRAIPLLDFLLDNVNCYNAEHHYRTILDSYRNLPSAVPKDWKMLKKIISSRREKFQTTKRK